MNISVIVANLLILQTVAQSCLWYETPTGEKYELSCGMSDQLRCKFSVEYATIKPEEIRYEMESGFGDGHYDTSKVYLRLKCSFRPGYKGETGFQGPYNVAIVSAKDGNITHAMIEYNKGKEKGSSWEVLKWGHGGYYKHFMFDFDLVLKPSEQQAGTVYACLCPKQKYTMRNIDQGPIIDMLPSNPPVNLDYIRSPSQYTVPVYSPCKQSACSDKKYKNMQHCYEINNNTKLIDLSSEKIRSLVKSCTEMNSLSKNWFQEKWSVELSRGIFSGTNDLTTVQNLHVITSKTMAQQVCTLMPLLKDWWNIDEHKSAMFDQHLKLVSKLITSSTTPVYNPYGEDYGAMLLLHGYNKRHSETLVTKGKDHIKCTQHVEMLEAMKLGSIKGAKIHKFYAKTYPTCGGEFEGEFEKKFFALFFNKVPAFFNSKHVSFNQDPSDNILILRTPNNNSAVLNTNKIYREQKIDCSLYERSGTDGTKISYSRIKLESDSPNKKTNANSQVLTFRISKTLLGEWVTEYLVGCYIKYNYYCEGKPCYKTSMLKKMQFYIELKEEVRYFDGLKDGWANCVELNQDEGTGWHLEKDDSGVCECVHNISLCSPLKTTSSLRIKVACFPKSPAKPTTFIIVLFVIGGLMLGAALILMFISKIYKSKSVLNGAKTPIDGSKTAVSSQK